MPREETIQVKIDNSLANKSISELRKQATDLHNAFGSIKVGDSVKAISSQNKLEKESIKIAQEKAKASKEAANATKALASAEKELENATKAKLQAQKEAQNVATAQVKTQKEAANLSKALASAEKEQANAAAAKSRAEKAAMQTQAQANKMLSQGATYAKNYGTALMSTIKQVVGFTGVVQSLRSAFSEMKNMNDELVTYRKVTGATAEQMEQIRESAYKTAKKYGQTPSDFLASASNMARAGYGENSVAMAELATKTQLVGDMTSDAASKFLLAVDAGYKYKGNIEQLTAVLDAANEVDNNYATSIAKISEGMTLVASLAGSVHVPIEQLTAALGTMTATTQRSGAEMARGLRSIFLNVLKDTSSEIEEGVTVTEENIESLTDALEKYGDSSIAAARKAGKLINPMEAIASLAKAWKEGKLDEQTLFGISKAVAGQRYYNAFSSLIQNYDMYESMLKSIGNSAGSAQKEVNAMLDSWTVKANQLKTTWTEVVNNTVSDKFIKNLIDGGTSALEFAGNLENLALMAGGAYKAIQALSKGIQGVSTTGKFGGLNAWTLGISAAIAAIGTIKAYGDQQFANTVKEAQEAAKRSQEAVSKFDKLNGLIAQYKHITKDGIIDKNELETVKSLQSQIKDIIGEQASNYDLVNGKISEQIQLLDKISKQQAESAYLEAKANTATAAQKLKAAQDDWQNRLTGAGFRYDKLTLTKEQDKLASFIRERFGDWTRELYDPQSGKTDFSINLGDRVGTNDIVEFYKNSKELMKQMASVFTTDQLSSNGFFKDLTDGVNLMAPAVEAYISAVESENGALARNILLQDDYSQRKLESEEDILDYVDTLTVLNDLTEEQSKALSDVLHAFINLKSSASNLENATNSQNKAFEEETKKAYTLEDAINAATKAKQKFDDAMKTSKADGMKSYAEAYKTYQKELKAGRTSSTAFYASARMLLGDDAYEKTGGYSVNIRKAMNRKGKGTSGSINEANTILNKTYKDKNGNVIEGYGVFELLKRTKGFNKGLVDKNGNINIPSYTDKQLTAISKQWNGLNKDMIVNYLRAFEQYNKGGRDDELKKKEQLKAEETHKKAEEAAKKRLEAEQKATEAAQQKEEESAKSAEEKSEAEDANTVATEANTAALETANEKEPETESAPEEAPGKTGDVDAGVQKAEEYKAVLDELEDKLNKIKENPISIEVNSDSIRAIETLSQYLLALSGEEGFEIDVTTGEAVNTTTGELISLNEVLQAIDTLKNGGVITEEVEASLKGDITGELEQVYTDISEANKNPPEVTIGITTEDAETHYREWIDSLPESKEFTLSKPKGAENELGNIIDGLKELKGYTKDDFNFYIKGDIEADLDQRLTSLVQSATTLDQLKEIYLGLAANDLVTPEIEALIEEKWKEIEINTYTDPSEARKAILGVQDNNGEGYTAEVGVEADPDPFNTSVQTLVGEERHTDITANLKDDAAKKAIADLVRPDVKNVTVKVRTTFNGSSDSSSLPPPDGGKSNVTNSVNKSKIPAVQSPVKTVLNYPFKRNATGSRNFSGGLALVNDGAGPELIVNNGRAYVAGGGKPAIVNLEKGARIFTATQTRNILNNGGIPSFADGVTSSIKANLGKVTTDEGKKKTSTKKKTTSSSKKTTKKKDSSKEKDESYSKLVDLIDYIVNRIGTALDEQLKIIDAQITALQEERERAKQQNELEEKQKAVAEAQKDLQDAMNERTVRYLGEDGKWHWQADANKVKSAQESLDKAKQDLADYLDEMAFNQKIGALEDKKTDLQNNYEKISKTLSDIKDGVNTPTGSVTKLLQKAEKNGTAQEKEGAKAIEKILLPMMKKSDFSGNYWEALRSIGAATKGNPVMPKDSKRTLASLIAGAGGENIEGSLLATLTTAVAHTGANGKNNSTGAMYQTHNGNNYYVNGIQVDSKSAEVMPLSEMMRSLSVFSG